MVRAGERWQRESQVFGDADRHQKQHIDPLARAASDLHLEATAPLVYSPHVLNVAATRALTAHAWCLGPSSISAASQRLTRLRLLKRGAQLYDGLSPLKTPARMSSSAICIHTAAQGTYNASSCILNRCI